MRFSDLCPQRLSGRRLLRLSHLRLRQLLLQPRHFAVTLLKVRLQLIHGGIQLGVALFRLILQVVALSGIDWTRLTLCSRKSLT